MVHCTGVAVPPLVYVVAGSGNIAKYVDNYGIQILIYIMLGWGLNVVVGLAGLLDLGYVAFYAVGAYAYALLSTQYGLGFWAVLPLAGMMAATFGILLGFPVLRLRGDYLAIVTLGFAEVVRLVASNEIWLTKGTDGISGIPGPWKRQLGPDFNGVYLLIVLALLAAVFVLMRRIDRSPYGRVLRAIREDAQVAQVAGKPVLRFKVQAFSLSAAIAGLAGALYGHFTSYIAPDLFLPLITVYIFLAVAGGGKIINIASIAGMVGRNPAAYSSIAYSTSKGALVHFTRDLAVKWAPHNIQVNAIAQNFVDNPTYFPATVQANPNFQERLAREAEHKKNLSENIAPVKSVQTVPVRDDGKKDV